MQKYRKKEYPFLTVSEFVPSFGNHFEIRTYWIQGRYAYSVATLTEKVKGGGSLSISKRDTFKSEGGTLPDDLKKKLQEEAKHVIRSLPQYIYGHPLMRIDFGCCHDSRACDEGKLTYFVNEVETLPANLLATDTKFPVVEKLSEALYRFARKVKNKKNNPRPKKSNYKQPSKCLRVGSKKKHVN